MIPNYSNLHNREYSINDMQQLADEWYDAAKNNLSSNKAQPLYEKTKNVENYLKMLESSLYYKNNDESVVIIEKIVSLCNAFIKGCNAHGVNESKFLAEWIKENTGIDQGRYKIRFGNLRYSGAFKSFHNFFKEIRSIIKAPEYCTGNTKNVWTDRSNLALVDAASKFYIEAESKVEIPDIYDVKEPIFSNLNLEELLSVRSTSVQNKDKVDTILLNLLNKKKISFEDINILQFQDIVNFFGTRSSELLHLHLDIIANDSADYIANIVLLCSSIESITLEKDVKVTPELLKILQNLKTLKNLSFNNFNDSMAFDVIVKNCPQIKTISLECFDTLTDISSLNNCKELRSLYITDCKNINKDLELKDCDLKSLIIVNCPITNIICPSLTTLSIETCPMESISCPSLKSFLIENWVINNGDLLKDCTQLEELAVYACNFNDINLENNPCLKSIALFDSLFTDIYFLKKISSLNTLIIENCPISSINVLQYLPSLEIFEISGCENVTNIEVLNQCPSLKIVKLDVDLPDNTYQALLDYDNIIRELRRRKVAVTEL